jgi:hypothetical protein
MTDKVMPFTAVAQTGQAFDIAFPLHPETGNSEAVSTLVTRLLDTISEQARSETGISDGDVLQALAITSAIRGRLVDSGDGEIGQLTSELYGTAWQAILAANSYTAGRA